MEQSIILKNASDQRTGHLLLDPLLLLQMGQLYCDSPQNIAIVQVPVRVLVWHTPEAPFSLVTVMPELSPCLMSRVEMTRLVSREWSSVVDAGSLLRWQVGHNRCFALGKKTLDRFYATILMFQESIES